MIKKIKKWWNDSAKMTHEEQKVFWGLRHIELPDGRRVRRDSLEGLKSLEDRLRLLEDQLKNKSKTS